MKVIDCDKIVKKKNELSVIYKQLKYLADRTLAHPTFIPKELTTSQFLSQDEDGSIQMKSFLYDIDVTMGAAFSEKYMMRLSITFRHKKKKKTKLIKILRDFIYEAEQLFGFLDKTHITKDEYCYYLDMYKDLHETMTEGEN